MSDNLRDVRRSFRTLVAVTASAVLLVADPAVAGVLNVDANAMPGWAGTLPFSGSNFSETHFFYATVDYAVYAPGANFDDSHGSGADPSGGGADYVYAYQVFHTEPPLGDPPGDSVITEFTVGLDGDEIVDNIDFVASTGVSPNEMSFATGNTSAGWRFNANPLESSPAPADESAILIFTSPDPPHYDKGALRGENLTADEQGPKGDEPRDWGLPSPVPEPGTLILLAFAAAMLVRISYRARCR